MVAREYSAYGKGHNHYSRCLLAHNAFCYGVEPPETIFSHGWWMVEESKMGKSLGNAVDPHFLVDLLGADQFRYFLMRGMVLGQDAQFGIDRMVELINTELANNVGNIASRLFKLLETSQNSILPEISGLTEGDKCLMDEAILSSVNTSSLVREMKIDRALSDINILMNSINSYIETNAPWKLAKQPEILTGLRLFWQLPQNH